MTAIARAPSALDVSGAPEGFDAFLAAEAARRLNELVLFIAADDGRANATLECARFFAPGLRVLDFPAWDCLPYDRVSPRSDIESRRLSALAALSARDQKSGAALLVTTVNAMLQRVAPRAFIAEASFLAISGKDVDRDALTRFVVRNAYSRTVPVLSLIHI